jgi:hypothetical protein
MKAQELSKERQEYIKALHELTKYDIHKDGNLMIRLQPERLDKYQHFTINNDFAKAGLVKLLMDLIELTEEELKKIGVEI